MDVPPAETPVRSGGYSRSRASSFSEWPESRAVPRQPTDTDAYGPSHSYGWSPSSAHSRPYSMEPPSTHHRRLSPPPDPLFSRSDYTGPPRTMHPAVAGPVSPVIQNEPHMRNRASSGASTSRNSSRSNSINLFDTPRKRPVDPMTMFPHPPVVPSDYTMSSRGDMNLRANLPDSTRTWASPSKSRTDSKGLSQSGGRSTFPGPPTPGPSPNETAETVLPAGYTETCINDLPTMRSSNASYNSRLTRDVPKTRPLVGRSKTPESKPSPGNGPVKLEDVAMSLSPPATPIAKCATVDRPKSGSFSSMEQSDAASLPGGVPSQSNESYSILRNLTPNEVKSRVSPGDEVVTSLPAPLPTINRDWPSEMPRLFPSGTPGFVKPAASAASTSSTPVPDSKQTETPQTPLNGSVTKVNSSSEGSPMSITPSETLSDNVRKIAQTDTEDVNHMESILAWNQQFPIPGEIAGRSSVLRGFYNLAC